jgi:hypothetical protein
MLSGTAMSWHRVGFGDLPSLRESHELAVQPVRHERHIRSTNYELVCACLRRTVHMSAAHV